MEITLDQAINFCTVVEKKGYMHAAEKLNKSHTSLIYSIKNLEQQCGFDLFSRTGYKNTITQQGYSVYLKCLEILEKTNELKMLCSQFKSDWEPNIKITYDGILPIKPFLKIYKKIREEKIPTLIQTYTDYLENVELSFHSLNAHIMISVLPNQNKDLHKIYLKPLKMYLVAHKEHEVHQSTKKWQVKDLQNHSFLTIRKSQNELQLNTEEFEEQASFYLSDFSFKKEALLKKMGFGWLPEHLISHELRHKILVPVKWERKSVKEIQPILYTRKNNQAGKATQIITQQFLTND